MGKGCTGGSTSGERGGGRAVGERQVAGVGQMHKKELLTHFIPSIRVCP